MFFLLTRFKLVFDHLCIGFIEFLFLKFSMNYIFDLIPILLSYSFLRFRTRFRLGFNRQSWTGHSSVVLSYKSIELFLILLFLLDWQLTQLLFSFLFYLFHYTFIYKLINMKPVIFSFFTTKMRVRQLTGNFNRLNYFFDSIFWCFFHWWNIY